MKKEVDVYKNLVNKLKEFDKFITLWNNYDLDAYIKSLNSISLNTIVKYEQYIKKFYAFVCKEEGVAPKYIFLTRGNKYYINYEKLFATIISKEQYHMLKNILEDFIEGKEYNTRDKLLIELAWEGGLTVDEIKNLKEKDIVFENISDMPVARLELMSGRIVTIYDLETIRDIKKTMAQTEYYLPSKIGRKSQIRKLKETEYLIKAVKTNISNKDTASNLSQILKKVLERVYVLPDVDLDSLTMESIRRSRAIEMLRNNSSLDDVREFLGKKTDCDLYWLQELALKINKLDTRMIE